MANNYKKGFRSVYRLTAHVVLVTKYRKKAIESVVTSSAKEILARLKQIFLDTLKKWECEKRGFQWGVRPCSFVD